VRYALSVPLLRTPTKTKRSTLDQRSAPSLQLLNVRHYRTGATGRATVKSIPLI